MLIKKQGKLKCSFDKSWGVQIKQEKTMVYDLGNLWGKLAQEIESFYPKIIKKFLGKRYKFFFFFF
jgi:hypothetical protein